MNRIDAIKLPMAVHQPQTASNGTNSAASLNGLTVTILGCGMVNQAL